MEIAGIGQASQTDRAVAIMLQITKLLELQGELVVELIESARVPGPADSTNVSGMGIRIDIHI